MNDDDRLLLDVRSWLKDEDVVPPDAEQAGRLVAAELPETRQLRRTRWSLPTLTRKNSSPTIDQTTAYQPSPIPATNGHTPTVIGRTQSMLSPVKAITAGALVFAIGGALLIAQPFEQQGAYRGRQSRSHPRRSSSQRPSPGDPKSQRAHPRGWHPGSWSRSGGHIGPQVPLPATHGLTVTSSIRATPTSTQMSKGGCSTASSVSRRRRGLAEPASAAAGLRQRILRTVRRLHCGVRWRRRLRGPDCGRRGHRDREGRLQPARLDRGWVPASQR